MTGAILRGRKNTGYRTTTPLECPHCHGLVDIAAAAAEDRQGPHLMLYPVAPRPGEYDAATLRHVMHGSPQDALVTGVALPQAPGRGEFRDDPVPDFRGDR